MISCGKCGQGGGGVQNAQNSSMSFVHGPLLAASTLRAVHRLNPLAIRVATVPVPFSVPSRICKINFIKY